MSSTPTSPRAAPTQRFRLIIHGLLRSIGARTCLNLLTGGYPAVGMARLPGPMATLISARFQRAAVLFAALAERVRLGTVRTYSDRASPRRAAPSDTSDTLQAPCGASPEGTDPAAPRLPQTFGGVLGLLHWEGAACAGALRRELADPEMVALLQSSPGFARILRPLCRMLAVVPPAGLFPAVPRRPRRRPRRAENVPTFAPHAACPESPPHAGYVQQRPFVLARPRPAAGERRLETRIAGQPRKT